MFSLGEFTESSSIYHAINKWLFVSSQNVSLKIYQHSLARNFDSDPELLVDIQTGMLLDVDTAWRMLTNSTNTYVRINYISSSNLQL